MEKHDVFISYAHLDEGDEWVSQFDDAFRKDLSIRLGKKAKVWRDLEMRPGDHIDETVRENLLNSRTLISIVSNSYLSSGYCIWELSTFFQNNQDKDSSVVFGVRRMPIKGGEISRRVEGVFQDKSFRRFFGMEKEESVREKIKTILDEFIYIEFVDEKDRTLYVDRDKERRTKFLDYVSVLTEAVYESLSAISTDRSDEPPLNAKPATLQPFRGKQIYLAEPSPDLEREYLEVKSDFLNRGAIIRPHSILRKRPALIEEYLNTARAEVENSDLIVHFVGLEKDFYSETVSESLVRKQYEISSKFRSNPAIPRLVLIKGTSAPSKDDDLIRDSFEGFRNQIQTEIEPNTDLLRNLQDLTSQMEVLLLRERNFTDKNINPSIYILSQPEDRVAADKLRDTLFELGCEVLRTSASSGADILEQHQYYLTTCDSVLVYWDAAKMLQVRQLMREFVSSLKDRQGKDFLAKGLCITGKSKEKDTFQTHVSVIRTRSEIERFVATLKLELEKS